jgi:hypothetical protein
MISERSIGIMRRFRMNTLSMRLFVVALLTGALVSIPATSFAQISIGIGISVNIEPPALPVYVQPPCPQPNFMWTPGYWAWDGDIGDYYWIPGTWVEAPQPGYLWTPGYWGWGEGGAYAFHTGYWGTQVGFYGGVNYGFGYGGGGFAGGEWRGGVFAYNTAAVSVNTTVIRSTYVNNTVINNTTIVNNTHSSFNGGPNGVAAKPTPEQETYASQKHLDATPAQLQHEQVAKQDKSNFASANHGVPAHAAVARPATSVAQLQHSAVAAKAAPGVKPYVARPAAAAKAEAHPAAAAKPEAHPAAAAKPESHPAAAAKSEAHPAAAAKPEAHPAAAAKPEAHPAAAAKPEAHPAAAAKPEARPAPAAKPEARPSPAPKPAPRPAPPARPKEKEPPAEHHPGN